jgi:hypothetical protein
MLPVRRQLEALVLHEVVAVATSLATKQVRGIFNGCDADSRFRDGTGLNFTPANILFMYSFP